jgi:hypothetical protein
VEERLAGLPRPRPAGLAPHRAETPPAALPEPVEDNEEAEAVAAACS